MHTIKCESCRREVKFRTYKRDWPEGWKKHGQSRYGKQYNRQGVGCWCPGCHDLWEIALATGLDIGYIRRKGEESGSAVQWLIETYVNPYLNGLSDQERAKLVYDVVLNRATSPAARAAWLKLILDEVQSPHMLLCDWLRGVIDALEETGK